MSSLARRHQAKRTAPATIPPDHRSPSPRPRGAGTTSTPFGPVVQAKLRIGAANGTYEHEADQVADQVMRNPEPAGNPRSDVRTGAHLVALQRQCTACESGDDPCPECAETEERAGTSLEPAPARNRSDFKPNVALTNPKSPPGLRQARDTHVRIDSSLRQELATHLHRGRDHKPPAGGRPLERNTRDRLEHGYGALPGSIVVHDDAAADSFVSKRRAQAVTIGNHIFLSAARRDPDRTGNFRVLAHEVAHTLQQSRGNSEAGISDPTLKRRLEVEADTAAVRVAAGRRPQVHAATVGRTPQHLDKTGTDSTADPDLATPVDEKFSAEELVAQGEQLLGRLYAVDSDTMSMPADTVERINANYAHIREEAGRLVPLPDQVLRAAPGSTFVPAVTAPAVVVIVIEIPLWVVVAIIAALVVFALAVIALLGYAAYRLIKWILDDVEDVLDAPPVQTQPQVQPLPADEQGEKKQAPVSTAPDESTEKDPAADEDEDETESQRPCCCEVLGPPRVELVCRISDNKMMGHYFKVHVNLANRRTRDGEAPSECRFTWREGGAAASMVTYDGDLRPDMEGWRSRTRALTDTECNSAPQAVTDTDMPVINLSDHENKFRRLLFEITAASGCDGREFTTKGEQVLNAYAPLGPPHPLVPQWVFEEETQISYLEFDGTRLDPEPYASICESSVVTDRIQHIRPPQ